MSYLYALFARIPAHSIKGASGTFSEDNGRYDQNRIVDTTDRNILPNEMEQDWEGEEYHELEEEQVLFDGADLIPYVSEIQEKIAEYSRVGHEDDKTDNLMDYFDGSAAIKEKYYPQFQSVKKPMECIWLYNLRTKGISGNGRIIGTV